MASENTRNIAEELKSTCDIDKFLDLLMKIKDEYLIVIGIRDTPGNQMSEETIRKIRGLGFTNFTKELWRMYAGVCDKGDIICNSAGALPEMSVNYSGCVSGVEVAISSNAWRAGNKCEIMIDGVNYAINIRGINIVVYDTESHNPIDSIGFDIHDGEKKSLFVRRPLRTLKVHYDIAVAGVWFGVNYGSLINGYAIYNALKKMGYSVLMINKPNAAPDDWELNNPHCKRFISNFYPNSDISSALPFDKLIELNDYCDTFLVGSDQIWHYGITEYYNYAFMLGFVNDDKRKISFGTSFGHKHDYTPESARPKVKSLLSRFDAISMREQSGVDICRDIYGVNAVATLEPVFCLTADEYKKIAERSDININEPYILSYILDPNPEKIKAIEYYCSITGMKSYNVLDGDPFHYEEERKTFNLPDTLEDTGAEDLIKLCMGASFVITDSFHGTCFSVIFNKPFLSIANHERGIVRFQELAEKFGFRDRLAEDETNIPLDKRFLDCPDFTQANTIIVKESRDALDWLKNSLGKPSINMAADKKQVFEAEVLHKNPEFIKIRILATLLRDYGIKHIVLSPGGRDVPLVRMFEYNEEHFVLHSVTDERSAAYFGMGIAAQLRQPVVCVCTSGTAASNYLPAVTEAYYMGVPLIVVTADRQQVYLNHGEDQTIPQQHIYDSIIKKSITVPEGVGYKAEYQTRRDISDCILESTHNGFGPVHINIAIDNIAIGANVSREYWKLLPQIDPHITRIGIGDGDNAVMELVNALKQARRILVVYGQNPPPTAKQLKDIEEFASKFNCVIVTDHISNLDCAYSLKPYNMLQTISNDEFNQQLSPDILITVGGKRLMNDPLTFRIRGGAKNIRHWSVAPDGKIKDFYFRLTSVIEMPQDYFFERFSAYAGDIRNDGIYFGNWKSLTEKYAQSEIKDFHSIYVQSKFIPAIPEHSILHLGVGQSFYDCRRFKLNKNVEVFCNMGTNGIDGCTSTFMGQCSVVKDKLCFLLVGDLSFFYDMNGIWNKSPGKNVRILMVNNNGSGLLRGNGLKRITAAHNTSAKGWVESTGFKYMTANTKDEYEEKLAYFISDESDEPLFFEVFCE